MSIILRLNPLGADLAALWDAMGPDRGACGSLTTLEALTDDVATGRTLLTAVYIGGALTFVSWMHHRTPGDTMGWLAWMGGWAHPDWRGRHVPESWGHCRQSFVGQGITIFCTAVARSNRASAVMLRRLGFLCQAGEIEDFYRGLGRTEPVTMRVLVEDEDYAGLAYRLAMHRAEGKSEVCRI